MNKISTGVKTARSVFLAVTGAVRSAGPRLATKIGGILKSPDGRKKITAAIPALRGRSLSAKQILGYVKANPLNTFFALSMVPELVYLVDELVDSDPEFAAAAELMAGTDTVETLSLPLEKREEVVAKSKAALAEKAAKIENLTVAQLRNASNEVEALELAISAMPGDSVLAQEESLRAIMRVVASGDEVFLLREALRSLK